MKAVVIYEPGNTPMDKIMATYPRHKIIVDAFAARGEVLGIGPFGRGGEGSMGIFKDRAIAESFVAQDPFVLEGLVTKYRILDWADDLLK
jgi:uncharacterized protein YciI